MTRKAIFIWAHECSRASSSPTCCAVDWLLNVMCSTVDCCCGAASALLRFHNCVLELWENVEVCDQGFHLHPYTFSCTVGKASPQLKNWIPWWLRLIQTCQFKGLSYCAAGLCIFRQRWWWLIIEMAFTFRFTIIFIKCRQFFCDRLNHKECLFPILPAGCCLLGRGFSSQQPQG